MTVDEEGPPQWLNSEYISKVLKEALKEPLLVVKSCVLAPATAAGDHYASQMFRASLKISKKPGITEDLSIICKTLPLGDARIMLADVFDVETKMLKEVLPEINKSLQNALAKFQPLNAVCLYQGSEPEYIIMMEDLKESGFLLADRMKGLDLKTSSLVMQAIAQLHAGSLLIEQKTPKLLQPLRRNFWASEDKVFLRIMVNSSLASLIEAASEWPDFPPEYLRKLNDVKENVFEKMIEAVKYDNRSLAVIQHGDCWVNNMMFKGDASNYNDFRFVDFQISHYNSAAVDLNYFIFTSPAPDIRLEKIDEMLKIYYDTFMDVTEKLGANVPSTFTFEELKRDFRNRAFFGFIATILVYPITITEKKDVMNVNDILDDKMSKKGQYNLQTFKQVFNMVMPYFIDCGVL